MNETMTTGEAPGTRTVALVSVSIDLGAGRRGVDMGPSALRIAGVDGAVRALGHEVVEAGTVHAPEVEMLEEGETRTRYLAEIVDVCTDAHALVNGVLEIGCFPLILGGDHSLSIGTVSAVARHHRERGEAIGLVWVDAHTDMNTPETTTSGNVHGMPLAVLVGRGAPELLEVGGVAGCVDPERVSVLGARRIDPLERDAVKESGVRVFTMSELDERGTAACVNEALDRAMEDTAGFVLSFDLDAVDPLVAPGVGTSSVGGITYREAHLVCEKAADSGSLLALELVELNPVLDEGNRTARVGVGLIESALGKTIL